MDFPYGALAAIRDDEKAAWLDSGDFHLFVGNLWMAWPHIVAALQLAAPEGDVFFEAEGSGHDDGMGFVEIYGALDELRKLKKGEHVSIVRW